MRDDMERCNNTDAEGDTGSHRRIHGGLGPAASRQARSSPQLFRALECENPLAPPAKYSLGQFEAAVIGRSERRFAQTSDSAARTLQIGQPDCCISREHARLRKAMGRWIVEDNDSRNGTFLNGLLVKQAALKDGDVIELGHTFYVYRQEVAPTGDHEAVEGLLRDTSTPGLATLEPRLAQDLQMFARIAPSTVSVIILGESGTGKEVVARALHRLSGRPGPFVGINCAALPESLVEAELFGYRKGAFSGATEDHLGLIRSADRGTLFLDEVGDMPLACQTKLLRVLQERQVVPVGSTQPIGVDIRLCAATHRQLDKLLLGKELREDLFARISGMTLQLPPLRERREDLGSLIAAMLRRFAPERAERIVFSSTAARAIFAYHWPLNIRELEKCLQAAIVMAADHLIRRELLPSSVRDSLQVPRNGANGGARALPVDAARRDELLQLLAEYQGNISAVARVMGKARLQIRRWIRRYEIDVQPFRAA